MLAAAESWALFFHLFGAFVFVAGVVVAGVAFEAARRCRRPSEIVLLLGLTRIGVLLVALGTAIVLPFGLWLVHLGHFGYGTAWVDAALVLFVLAVVLGGAGGQRPKRARKLATQISPDDDAAISRLRALLDDPIALILNYLSAILVLAIVALMVFKPGAD